MALAEKLDLKNPIHVGYSTGGAAVARYIGLPVTKSALTDSTVSSAANATNESGGEAEPQDGSGVVADGPRCVVYGALAGRLTAERRGMLLVDGSVCSLV